LNKIPVASSPSPSASLRSHWRLSAFYFGYFAVIGGLSPYWGAYLAHLGLASHWIGFLIAIPMITRLIAPYLWGWLADATGERLRGLRWGTAGALIAFSTVCFEPPLIGLIVATAVFSFFWNGVLPQFESLTLAHLGDNSHHYSRIRLWGSVGFIVMVLSLGALLDVVSIGLLPVMLAIAIAGVWLLTLQLKNPPLSQRASAKADLKTLLSPPVVRYFLVAAFLLQISNGAYYGFYTLYLEEAGYRRLIISGLWTLGVLAEILLFWYLPRFLPRWSLRHCLLMCLLAAALRWALIAAGVDHLGWLMLAQVGHAFTFGLMHASAMKMVRSFFGAAEGRGQAIYSAWGYGAGAALGTYLAGWMWHLGGDVTFMASSVLALVTSLWVWWCMPKTDQQ
jgi:MFS transporter, PPP family, 3-phenylpropionic acid transporter